MSDYEGGDWQHFSTSADGLTQVDRLVLDNGDEVFRTTYFAASDPLFDLNEEAYNASLGQRWKDGQVAARIPMSIWAREIAPRQRDGNTASLKRWLNDSENRAFRTFEGNI
jgi:hypothetical protein